MSQRSSHAELLRRRYGRQPQPQGVIWNAQVEHLLAHHSQRAFLPDPVTDAEVATIVAAAQSAPSSSNQHLWSVIAVRDPDTKHKLAEITRGASMGGKGYEFVADAPLVLLWVADMSRNDAVTRSAGIETENVDYLDAFLMASVDTALAAQNGLIAAQSLGLGGVYLGSMRNDADQLAEMMSLPQYAYVVFGMALGRPDPKRLGSVRPRPPQDVVLHHERYDSSQAGGWVDGYEDALRRFRSEAGMRDKTWTDSVTFASSLAYMDGRENLRHTVERRGYTLR